MTANEANLLAALFGSVNVGVGVGVDVGIGVGVENDNGEEKGNSSSTVEDGDINVEDRVGVNTSSSIITREKFSPGGMII